MLAKPTMGRCSVETKVLGWDGDVLTESKCSNGTEAFDNEVL